MLATPAIYAECLPRDMAEVEALADDWEWRAIEVIVGPGSDGLPRSLVDVTPGGDCGFAHFDGCDLLPGGSPDAQVALLYSDWSAAIQLARWRDQVGPAVRRSPLPRATTAVLANSLGSRGLLDLGERHGWDLDAMCAEWAVTRHRRMRCAAALGAG